MGTLLGYDVSNLQPDVNHDLAKRVGGASFCFAKISQGASFVDKLWVGGRPDSVRKAGLKLGGYHYAEPALHSPVDEANHCTRVLNGGGGFKKGKDIPITVDFEEHPLPTQHENRAWIRDFARVIQRNTGHSCLLYGSTSFLEEHLDHLPHNVLDVWVASYPSLQIPAVVPRSGGRVKFHQFTDTGRIAGVPGDCDLNVFYGNKLQLWHLCK